MGQVYDQYTDTGGNIHYTDVTTGHHIIPRTQMEQEGRNMTIERYRLTLEHEYIDSNGKVHKIEDPIRTDYNIIMGESNPPTVVIINEMLERLKYYMLNIINREEGT